jgi:hypothetical protein
MITDTIGIEMKYPTIELLDLNEDELLLACIKCVFDKEEVYTFSEFSKAEQTDWLDSLDTGALLKIMKFLKTVPYLNYDTTVTTKDGDVYPLSLSGLEDFFI